MELELVLVQTLVQWFDEHPAEPVPSGDRVFTRWVCCDPDDPGWDDWKLLATVDPDGLDPVYEDDYDNPLFTRIANAVAGGKASGRETDGMTTVWWVRHVLDGPPERVSDWMNT